LILRPSGQAVRSRFYFAQGKTIKLHAILHANNKKMFTLFLKSGITSKPSTEIEANNYDKLLVENVKNQVVSIEFLLYF
jgi:hypothetical protein